MSNSIYGLLFTFLVGLSFLIVLYISKFLKHNNKFIILSFGLTFVIMLGMIFFGLLPEAYELFEGVKLRIPLIIGASLIGFFIIYSLDAFVPDHHDDNKKLDHDNLLHISVITTIALVIHNFIEGASLYTVTLTNVKSGFLMSLAIILHNIPLALTIMLSLGKDKKRNIIIITSLVISSLLGGLFIYLFSLTGYVTGVLISITLGMIIYLVFVELFKEVKKEIKNKYCYIGMIIGVILVIILFLI